MQDTTAELNAVSICRPSSYTSSWLFSQHIRCISNRDFSVLLRLANNSYVHAYTLNFFVCSTCLEDSTTVVSYERRIDKIILLLCSTVCCIFSIHVLTSKVYNREESIECRHTVHQMYVESNVTSLVGFELWQML